MRRIFAFCTACVCLFCASCAGNPLRKTYSFPSSPTASRPPGEIPAINNTLPPNQLITSTCDIHAIAQKYFQQGISITSFYLKDVAADFGVECLRETEAGALYSVHSIAQGGRLYLFYANFDDDPSALPDRRLIRWFYVQKPLSHADFADVGEGTPFEEVKRIDPTLQIFENLYYSDTEAKELIGGLQAWIYLTNGILDLDFVESNEGLRLGRSRLYENFKLNQYNTSINYPYNGRILDMDRVK